MEFQTVLLLIVAVVVLAGVALWIFGSKRTREDALTAGTPIESQMGVPETGPSVTVGAAGIGDDSFELPTRPEQISETRDREARPGAVAGRPESTTPGRKPA